MQVGAGNSNFVHPRHIPKAMRGMCEEFQRDVEAAEKARELDPFLFAAKYANHFVQIHPFEDGNGRVSRLILNAVLMKYAGITVAIGQEEESRKRYLEVVREAGENAEGGNGLAALVVMDARRKLEVLAGTLKERLRRGSDVGLGKV